MLIVAINKNNPQAKFQVNIFIYKAVVTFELISS